MGTFGRVWMVTGAGRGFGAKIVGAALERGDAVVATARSPRAIVEQFGERPGLRRPARSVRELRP